MTGRQDGFRYEQGERSGHENVVFGNPLDNAAYYPPYDPGFSEQRGAVEVTLGTLNGIRIAPLLTAGIVLGTGFIARDTVIHGVKAVFRRGDR
jgi:hypothetical protein